MLRSFSLSFFPGLGYGFGFFAALPLPIARRFAFNVASMSKMSARIAFVFAVLDHSATSGWSSRMSSDPGEMWKRKDLTADQPSRVPMSES